MTDHPLDLIADAGLLITEADKAIAQLTDPKDLAEALLALRDLKLNVEQVFRDLEQVTARAMESRTLMTDSGTIERQRKIRRTGWKHDELVRIALSRAPEERIGRPATGEVESEAEAAVRVLQELCSLGAGKTTGLKARGFDPDEFCSVDDQGFTLRLPPVEMGGGS